MKMFEILKSKESASFDVYDSSKYFNGCELVVEEPKEKIVTKSMDNFSKEYGLSSGSIIELYDREYNLLARSDIIYLKTTPSGLEIKEPIIIDISMSGEVNSFKLHSRDTSINLKGSCGMGPFNDMQISNPWLEKDTTLTIQTLAVQF